MWVRVERRAAFLVLPSRPMGVILIIAPLMGVKRHLGVVLICSQRPKVG